MTNIVVLNSQAHRALRVQAGPSAALGDNQRFVPVVVKEFPFLAIHYPIFLSKDADTGAFYCGAMLGFDVGENLFLTGPKGPDAYRPLNLQRGPSLPPAMSLPSTSTARASAMTKGRRFSTTTARPTPYLESITAAMRELRPGAEMTKVFIETLMTMKLVEPIELKLGFDDGTKREVVGLYTINQDVLRSLPDTSVVQLFRRGYLQLIYLMIASLKQVPVLTQKKNRTLLGDDAIPPERVG